MANRSKIIAELVDRAKREGWDMKRLAEEVWDEAVDWAGGLVDYSAING